MQMLKVRHRREIEVGRRGVQDGLVSLRSNIGQQVTAARTCARLMLLERRKASAGLRLYVELSATTGRRAELERRAAMAEGCHNWSRGRSEM
jgi:hypothetical protein